MLDLATGYQRSKTLFVLIEFAIPTLLSTGARKIEVIAQGLEMDPVAARALLRAGVSLGLLENNGELYRNSALAETFLVKGKPTYLGDEFARYDHTSYPAWMDLASHLRQWRAGAADGDQPKKINYGPLGIRARHNLSRLVGHSLAEAYDFSKHRKLLDLGGEPGLGR